MTATVIALVIAIGVVMLVSIAIVVWALGERLSAVAEAAQANLRVVSLEELAASRERETVHTRQLFEIHRALCLGEREL